MTKQTKRMRKFASTGGVEGRLKKGTITNKGVLKRKGGKRGSTNRKKGDGPNDSKRIKMENNDNGGTYLTEQKQKRDDADFVSERNLGDLDMDSFFETFGEDQDGTDDVEKVTGMSDDDDDDEDSNGDDHGDDDDDDDNDGEDLDVVEKASNDISNRTKEGYKKQQGQREQNNDDSHSNGSDSDSEEEDVEVAERRMKEEMGKLQDKDPEFHRFLKENEQALLEYGVNDDDQDDDDEDDNYDDDDDDDDGDDEDGGNKVPKKKQTERTTLDDDPEDNTKTTSDDGTIQLTATLLEKMERGAFRSHGVKALKRMVNAFMSACHLADEDGKTFSKGKRQRYSIDSSDIFDRVMVLSLTKCHEEFKYHLLGKGASRNKNGEAIGRTKSNNDDDGDDDDEVEVGHDKEENEDRNKPINPKLLERAGRWNDLSPILFTFLKSTMHLLSEAKESELVVFVLKSLTDYVPFMTPYPRLAEMMLKTLTTLWSAPIDSSEDYQVVRLHSFLRIRQLALTQPFPFIEECLKKLYLAYAQRAKFATAASVSSALPTLTFMGNCVVELYSLDYLSSYQHAFIYIRQLALHLRTAMQKKTADALGAVYCWQFLHCLKVWVAVLTEACQSDDNNNDDGPASNGSGEEQLLRSLIFPLSQVILGTARLIPSTRYLPLRLHCVRLLQQLAAAAQIFLPTTSILLEVFDMSEFSQPPKKVTKSNIQPMALTLKLRPDNPLRSMEEMEMCFAEVFVLLNREIDLYRYSAGFPEFATRINQRLKKFAKEARHARWRAYAKGCTDLCDRYSIRAITDRAKLHDVAPKDVKQLEVLKPLQTPSMGERYIQSLEKEKRLEVASRPVQKTSSSSSSAAASGPNKEQQDDDESPSGGKSKKRKKMKSKRGKTSAPAVEGIVDGDLDEEDEVQEGINWSDDDDE